jgi:hypothetical protein
MVDPYMDSDPQPQSQPRSNHWWLPGIATVLFLIALPELFQAGDSFLSDPATARHLRAGEIMIAQGAIQQTDPFGCEVPPRPWIAFEWLFEVACAGLVRAGGLPLAYVVCFFLFALLPVLIWQLLMRLRIGFPVAFLYAVGASLVFRVHHLLRPLVFTYLFTLLVIGAWYRCGERPKRWAWIALPLLFILWANIHGGFAVGLMFLALSLAGRLADRLMHHQVPAVDGGLVSWGTLILVCANVTLLTPHGLALHRLIWEMVFHIKSFAQWNEFRPPALWPPSALGATALILLFILALGRVLPRRRPFSWEEALPLLLFLYFAFHVQRHVLLLVLVAAVPVCRELDLWLNSHLGDGLKKRLEAFAEIERTNHSALWQIPLIALVTLAVYLPGAQAKQLRVGAKNISPQAIEFLRAHRPQFQRPLVTTWNAGALLYYLAPDFRVTYDDRTEFYGDARLLPYIDLLRARPGWEKILTEGRFDSAILDNDFALTGALRKLPDWELVYEDKLAVIFVHRQ